MSYLYSRACPSHEEGLALLRDAAEQAGVEVELTTVEVHDDAQAVRMRFPGSPTYVVGGRDPFTSAGPAHAFQFDACRAFARRDGRIGPLPDRDDLVAALRAEAART